VIDAAMLLPSFILGFEDTTNSRRDNSDPILEAFVHVLFLGSERLNGRGIYRRNRENGE
jgi:hypothetical protein